MGGDSKDAAANRKVEQGIASVGSQGGEFRNVAGSKWNDFFGFSHGLQDQGQVQILFQEMLAAGEARGGLHIIGEGGDAENDSGRRVLRGSPSPTSHTALLTRPRAPQDASQTADE